MKISWRHTPTPPDGETVVAYYDLEQPTTELPAQTFSINSYQKLVVDPEENWERLLRPANRFLTSLTDREQGTLVRFFNSARDVNSIFAPSTIEKAAEHIGQKFSELAATLKLQDKLVEYVIRDTDIEIQEKWDAPGTVMSHMNVSDYHTLLAMSVLCKVMFPLFGEIMERARMSSRDVVTEAVCIPIILPALYHSREFGDSPQRLVNFVCRIIDDEREKNPAVEEKLRSVVSYAEFYNRIIAALLIKRFVTVDLMTPGGNLLVWIEACTRNTTKEYSLLLLKPLLDKKFGTA